MKLIFVLILSVINISLLIFPNVTYAQIAPNLFFSEYIEGSSYNKALEIFNPEEADIDLSGYKVTLYHNGNSYGSDIALSGIITTKGVFVLCHSSFDPLIINICHLTNGSLDFNGDDAVELKDPLGNTLDVIGQIGFRPVDQWGEGLISTKDNSLVRKCSVTFGDIVPTDLFDPLVEWEGFAINDFSHLGSHTLCISPISECGDGIIDEGEICDDGLNNGSYGYCKNDCSGYGEYCGDGLVNEFEECDGTGVSCVENSYQGVRNCSQECKLDSVCELSEWCGDKIINGFESCDDGNNVSGDGCDNSCNLEIQQSSISGFVYWDNNGNGNWDGWKNGEVKLNIYKVYIDENLNEKYDINEKCDLTEGGKYFPKGEYKIINLEKSKYQLCVLLSEALKIYRRDISYCQEVEILGGENKTNINFGINFQIIKTLFSPPSYPLPHFK